MRATLETPSEIANLTVAVKQHGGWIIKVKTSELQKTQRRLHFLDLLQKIVKSTEHVTEIVVSNNPVSLEMWAADAEFIQKQMSI